MNDDRYPSNLALRTDPVGPVQLALFAAAAGDHNPLHLDPQVAARAGFERPVVHGMLSMALAGRVFTGALGPACVRVLHTRFTGVALSGDALDLEATLEKVEGGRGFYTLRGKTVAGAPVLEGRAEVVA